MLDSKAYCTLLDSRKWPDGGFSALLKVNLPEMSNATRKHLVETIMEDSGASASLELFRSKGSIVRRDKREFSLILLFDNIKHADLEYLGLERKTKQNQG